ncbi:MAG: flippase-like domain-containing protein [Desulfobacteraceae bacterium]|nr:flippase-like domain-containing protein [Desulfobacteraceae bacterium]
MIFYKKYFFIILGFIFSFGFLWLAFRNVPLTDILSYFINVNYYLIFISVFITILSFFLRAVRWQILLYKKEKLHKTFHILMTGFMLNCIIPGRAGEIARPVMISRNPEISLFEALSTVAVERLFDLVMLLSFFFILIFFIHIPEDLSYKFGDYVLSRQLLFDYVSNMALIAVILFLCLLFVFYINKKKVFGLKLFKKFEEAFENIVKGIDQLKNTIILIKISLLSFIIWFLQICSYYFVVKACAGIDINFMEAAFVMIIICFFIAIPSVPGFWGVWEAGGIFAMSVLGIAKIDAAGFNLFNHAVQMIPVIVMGIISAWFISFKYNKMISQSHKTVVRHK